MVLTFAWRYFKAKKSTNAINIIAWVSVVAIVIGTASLIIILSAFNGFESLVKSLYSSFYPDLRIAPAKGKTLILSQDQINSLRKYGGLKSLTCIAEDKALLQNGDFQAVVFVKGVDEHYKEVSGVPQKMIRGNFNLGDLETPRIVLGVGIENAIGILSDRSLLPLTLYLPKKGVKDMSDPLNALSEGLVMPSGSFAIQQDFDNKYLITNIDFLKRYLNYKEDEYSAIEVSVKEEKLVEEVKKQIQGALGPNFLVENRYEQNRTLYSTINLEKWAIYGIFTLILLVAAFNMVGSLTMLVLEKKKDIQVLQAMGADQQLIRRIFMAEGMVLAGIGALAGIILALTLYFLQVKYKLVPLQGDSFLIDYYPVKLLWQDFALVTVTVFAIGMLASWFPAYRASKEPFELRN